MSTLLRATPGGDTREVLEKPRLEHIPPLLRRRLSPLARVVFQVLDHCATPAGTGEPLVYSSVLGEIQRTQALLEAIAGDQPISPAAFSLSVHNAIGGLWSQIRGVTAPVIALAPSSSSPSSPVPALLEAAGILAEGRYGALNLVFAEEACPDFYRPWREGPPGPAAIALRLVAARDEKRCATLSLRRVDIAPSSGEDRGPALPGFLGELLAGRRERATVSEPRATWQLERG